jgi:hypothetical protein
MTAAILIADCLALLPEAPSIAFSPKIKPAIFSAAINLPVSDGVDGNDVLGFLWWCLSRCQAEMARYIYVGASNRLTVVLLKRSVCLIARSSRPLDISLARRKK